MRCPTRVTARRPRRHVTEHALDGTHDPAGAPGRAGPARKTDREAPHAFLRWLGSPGFSRFSDRASPAPHRDCPAAGTLCTQDYSQEPTAVRGGGGGVAAGGRGATQQKECDMAAGGLKGGCTAGRPPNQQQITWYDHVTRSLQPQQRSVRPPRTRAGTHTRAHTVSKWCTFRRRLPPPPASAPHTLL